MTNLINEIRLTWRRLRRSPSFTFVYLLSLGTAVTAGIVVFSLLRSTVFSALPYPESDRLVSVVETRDGEDISVSWPNFQDWRESVATAELAAYNRRNVNLTGDGPALRLRALQITDNLFEVLEVQPLLGRAPADGTREVLLTHALWAETYGSDDDVLGRSILLDGEAWTVVGVLPQGIRFPDGIVLADSDLFLSITPVPDDYLDRGSHPGLYAIGRLNPGVGYEAFRTELTAIASRLSSEYPDTNLLNSVRVRTANEVVTGDLREPLFVLTGAVLLLLLAAMGNVSGLAATRAGRHSAEWGIRHALGAGRGETMRRGLAESLVLGTGTAVTGIAGAWLVLDRIPGWQPVADLGVSGELSRADVLLGIALAVIGSTVVSLTPTFLSLRAMGSLHTRARTTGVGRLGDLLVAGQIALATVLLVGAALLGRTMATIEAQDGGIDPDGVYAFRLSLPQAEYADDEGATRVLMTSLRDRVAAVPGIARVSGISTLPFSGSGAQSGMLPADRPNDEPIRTDVAVVFTDYFEVAGARVVEGRTFDERDGPGSPSVVVVDERLAERFWPGESAIGKRMMGWGLLDAEVIGVVGHVKNYGVTRESRAEMFMPHAQRAYINMWMLVETEGSVHSLSSDIRGAVAEVAPDLPVREVTAWSDYVDRTVSDVKVATGLGTALTLFTVFLAILGLRSLVAYRVQSRTKEFGLRMALGSESSRIRHRVLGGTLRLAGLGLIVGLIGAALASRTLQSLLFGVEATDPTSYLIAGVAILLVAVLSGDGPARRAARVDPQVALREE